MSDPTINFSIQTRQVQFAVPSELIKKNFKGIQKLVEKLKKQVADELAKVRKDPNLTPENKLLLVRKLIKNFEAFQKKLHPAIKKDEDFRLRLVARANHLSKLRDFTVSNSHGPEEGKTDDDDKTLDMHNENLINWYREETDLLIIDYLLKSNSQKGVNLGHKLMQFLEASSTTEISKLVDYDIYESFNEVFISINEDHDLEPISAWYNDNRNSLKKINSNLQFEIHYCKYLSMIERGEVCEAIAYCKSNLAPFANRKNYVEDDLVNYEGNLKRLTEVGAPLVFISIRSQNSRSKSSDSSWASLTPDSPVNCPPRYDQYSKLLSDERWRGLSQCFTEDFTKVYGISKTYPLLVYLSAGLSSLKTKSCYCNEENTIFKGQQLDDVTTHLDSSAWRDLALRGPNQYYRILKKINQCPVCSPELFRLSLNLPYAQLITSIFNNPFKLPNGNIYPFDKLLSTSEKLPFDGDELLRTGKVKDPLTQEIYFVGDCVRVFPA